MSLEHNIRGTSGKKGGIRFPHQGEYIWSKLYLNYSRGSIMTRVIMTFSSVYMVYFSIYLYAFSVYKYL